MKSVLLIGLGDFGMHIAKELSYSNSEVLAVDVNEDRVNEALKYVTDAQIGDCTNKEYIQSLGVSNFDVCVVTIGDDLQSSLVTVTLLKEYGAVRVVARASNEMHETLLVKVGADSTLYPEKQLASWTAVSCTSDTVLDYIKLSEDYAIFELMVPSEWIGKSVVEIDVRKKYAVNVLGIKRDDDLTMSISPSTVFEENDSVFVLGNKKSIQKAFKI
ncbi:MAG: TrkA family potassium uptake protein [Clostridia bacterium]|nr:TrkA family potassium uptake protein [Clostridia bacterium]